MPQVAEELFADGDGGVMSALRTLRLLRIASTMKPSDSKGGGRSTIAGLVQTTLGSITAAAGFSMLLMLGIFCYALFGMSLLGGKLQDEDGGLPRAHFDNFFWAMVTVFHCLTVSPPPAF